MGLELAMVLQRPRAMASDALSTSPPALEQLILLIRGQRLMLDSDLAALYGVETKNLNQAVRRNEARFPPDFMFSLELREVAILKSQIVTSRSWGGSRKLPLAFTEQGVAMLSSVLHTPRAIEVNIEIMRAFVRLRRLVLENADLARKLAALEKKYDGQFRIVFEAIRELMEPSQMNGEPARRIGFGHDGE